MLLQYVKIKLFSIFVSFFAYDRGMSIPTKNTTFQLNMLQSEKTL